MTGEIVKALEEFIDAKIALSNVPQRPPYTSTLNRKRKALADALNTRTGEKA